MVYWCVCNGTWYDCGRWVDSFNRSSLQWWIDTLMGVVPPIGDDAWNAVFEEYKAYPDIKKLMLE